MLSSGSDAITADLARHQREVVQQIIAPGPLRLTLISYPGWGAVTALVGAITLITTEVRNAKILVVTPSHAALEQWFTRVERAGVRDAFRVDSQGYRRLELSAGGGQSVWNARGVYVATPRILETEERLAEVLDVGWDLVVVDELTLTVAGENGAVAERLWSSPLSVKVVTATRPGVVPRVHNGRVVAQVVEWTADVLRESHGDWPNRSVEEVWYHPSEEELATRAEVDRVAELLPESSGRVLRRACRSSPFAASQLLLRWLTLFDEAVGADELSVTDDAMLDPDWDPIDLEALTNVVPHVEAVFERVESLGVDAKYDAFVRLRNNELADVSPLIVMVEFAATAEFLAASQSLFTPGQHGERYLGRLTGDDSHDARLLALAKTVAANDAILVLTDAAAGEIDAGVATTIVHYDFPRRAELLAERAGRIERQVQADVTVSHYFLMEAGRHPSGVTAMFRAVNF